MKAWIISCKTFDMGSSFDSMRQFAGNVTLSKNYGDIYFGSVHDSLCLHHCKCVTESSTLPLSNRLQEGCVLWWMLRKRPWPGWHSLLSAGEWYAGLRVFQIMVYVASLTLISVCSPETKCLVAVVFLFKTETSNWGDMQCWDAKPFLPVDTVEVSKCLWKVIQKPWEKCQSL